MRTLYVANPEYREEIYAPQPIICYDPPMIREIAHALHCDLLECLDMTRDVFRDCYPIADDELDQLLHGTMPLPDSEMEWILEMVYPAISLPRQ